MNRISAALLLAVFLAGCSRSGVEVRNVANAPITNIEIRVAGNELSIDRIDPGESRRIGYSTQTEDTFEISFEIQGEKKQCSDSSYVSPPFEDEFTVRIAAGGKCTIAWRGVD